MCLLVGVFVKQQISNLFIIHHPTPDTPVLKNPPPPKSLLRPLHHPSAHPPTPLDSALFDMRDSDPIPCSSHARAAAIKDGAAVDGRYNTVSEESPNKFREMEESGNTLSK